jgi:hypothetical protein
MELMTEVVSPATGKTYKVVRILKTNDFMIGGVKIDLSSYRDILTNNGQKKIKNKFYHKNHDNVFFCVDQEQIDQMYIRLALARDKVHLGSRKTIRI